MTKVSMRPQTGATPPPISKRALESPASACDAPAPDRVVEAFSYVSSALSAAAQTDEPHLWSGESDRLLRLAGDLAECAEIDDANGSDAQNIAYDIAALVKASRLVPGDTCSSERIALIEQARPHLVFLTGCVTVLADDMPSHHAARDPLHGYTPAQAALAFERIASMADTTRMLLHADAAGNEYPVGIMIESIGALADQMIDGEVIGTHADWTAGSHFSEAGKAVQA